MLKRRCPFIGLCGDPETVVAFASLRNCCNRVENPKPIRLSHQHNHCFTFEHRSCEVLLQEEPPSELPVTIAASPTRRRAAIIVGGIASFVVVTMFVVIGFGVWQPVEAVDQGSRDHLPSEAPINSDISNDQRGSLTPSQKVESQTDMLLPIVGVAATQTLHPSATVVELIAEEAQTPTAPTRSPTAISTSCGAPDGWVIYVVKVGDTLSSIAEDQGISVAELQNANCLTAAAVFVGQRLYVPHGYVSSPVPTWTTTATNAPPATAVFTNTPVPTKTPEPTEEPTQEPTQEPTEQPTLEPTATEIPPLPTETSPPVPSDTPLPLPTDPPGPTATPTPISLPVTPSP